MAPDKIAHLKAGALLAALLAVVVWLALTVGPGYAVAAGSVAMGIGVEWYQKARNEGQAEFWDAVASAAAGILGGIFYEITNATQ